MSDQSMPYPTEIQSLLDQSIIMPLHAERLYEMHKIDDFRNIMPYELIAKKIIEPMDAICSSREQLRALHMYLNNIITGESSVKTVLIEKQKLLDKLISGGMESAEKLYELHITINPTEENLPHYNDIQRLLLIAFQKEILTKKISIGTVLELQNSLKMLAKGVELPPKNAVLSLFDIERMTFLIKYVVENSKTFLSTNRMVESLEWENLAPYICLRLFGHAHHPCPEKESIYFSDLLKIAKAEIAKPDMAAPTPFKEKTSFSYQKHRYFNAAAAADYPEKENDGLAHPSSSFW